MIDTLITAQNSSNLKKMYATYKVNVIKGLFLLKQENGGNKFSTIHSFYQTNLKYLKWGSEFNQPCNI